MNKTRHSQLQRTGSPELLKVSEIARELHLSRARVYEMIAEGRIPSTRIGPRSIRIPREVWEAWKATHVDRAVESLRTPPPQRRS